MVSRIRIAPFTLLHTTQNQEKNNLCRRRVTFKEEPEIGPNTSPLDRLDRLEGYDKIWYQDNELGSFRNEAREITLALRRSHKCNRELTCIIKNNSGDTRGLEYGVCTERRRRKQVGTRAIVAVSKKMHYSPEGLAKFASITNRWATNLAVAEAAMDFVEAYKNEDSNNKETEPILTSKRFPEEAEAFSRRVRRRLNQPVRAPAA